MKQRTLRLNESDIANMVAKKLQEAFKSGKLSKFAKEHGGLKYGDTTTSFGNDLYNMSDDDFDDYQTVSPEEHYRYNGWQKPYGPKVSGLNNDNFKPLHFNDGTFMVKKNPDMSRDDRELALHRKKHERMMRKRDDGKDTYHSVDPERDKILNPPKERSDYKPRGKWGYPGEGNLGKNQLNKRALKALGWNPETTRINEDENIISYVGDDNQDIKELKKALHTIEDIMDLHGIIPLSEYSKESPSIENQLGHAYFQTKSNLVRLISLLRKSSMFTIN